MTDPKPKRQVTKLLTEFVVIVAGVLVALWAESWRESLGNRDREAAYIRALNADVATALGSLDEAFRRDSVYWEEARSVVSLLQGTGSPEDDVWRDWLGFRSSNVSLPDGTMRALIGTGDIALLRSEALRAAILELSASMEWELAHVSELDSRSSSMLFGYQRELEAISIATGEPLNSLSLASLRGSAVVRATHGVRRSLLSSRWDVWDFLREGFRKVEVLVADAADDDELVGETPR